MKIESNGIVTHYELTGNDANETVVLSHSLGSSLMMWDSQKDLLAENYRVLRYDTRGHGQSTAPPGAYTMDQLINDAVILLDTLEIDRAHWVGLSMGGMIGQGLALTAPDRLLSLTLCNTLSVIRDEMKEMWQNRIRSGDRFGMHHLVDATMERWFTEIYRMREPDDYRLIRKQFLETPVYGYVGCCHAIYHLNYVDQLHQIAIPTHIIAGDQDFATPVTESRVMHERIAGSNLDIIIGAAHLSNIEQKEQFNVSLTGFLHSL